MVSSLLHIAQSVCMQQAARITDVGDIPYHLLRPVLRRLNAKQLAIVETNSPALNPDSDELWAALCERDFANRPFNPKASQLVSSEPFPGMPNKNLYQQYSQERESFLASSAQRLRRITEKLQKEKTKNAIVAIPGVLADPSRRRLVSQPRTYNPSPKSILGKARRDVSQRHLMFKAPLTFRVPKTPRPQAGPNVATGAVRRTNAVVATARPGAAGARRPNSPGTHNSRLATPQAAAADLPSRASSPIHQHNQGIYSRPPVSSPERKRPSSVFLQNKRRRPDPRSGPRESPSREPQSRGLQNRAPQESQSQSGAAQEAQTSSTAGDSWRQERPKKTVRSSVFH